VIKNFQSKLLHIRDFPVKFHCNTHKKGKVLTNQSLVFVAHVCFSNEAAIFFLFLISISGGGPAGLIGLNHI